MNGQLNEQITNEFFAAHAYLQMSCVLEGMGLRMLAKWFEHHAAEEREHGMKIVHYVHEVGGKVRLDTIPKPEQEYADVEKIIQAALDHELEVTRMINELVALADEEKDYATRSFLQWFVDEQVEEVSVVTEVLDLVKLAGDKHMLQVEARVAKMLQSEGS
jgi:ferritin